MPKPLDTTIEPEERDDDRDNQSAELNGPKLDEKTGKPTKRAVETFKQAHGICKRLFDKANSGRLKPAGVVADKYAGSAPYRQHDLAKMNQLWRNNFSTNPLGSITDRSTPQLTDPIKQAESLTYSALPPEREDAAKKTRSFRLRTTKLIRGWSGFPSFMSQVAQEDYLYGNAAPAWIDDDWRPNMWRFDQIFLPEGVKQHSKQVQFYMVRQELLLHEFLKKIEDREVAADAGYKIEGCIKAVNESCNRSVNGSTDETPIEEVDAVRESGAMGYTYEGETKVVKLFHLLVKEYEGGVCLWTTAQNGGHGVRYVKDLHESMEDAITLFTLQEGNGTFYGSKGAGRQLANLHIALDRMRCHSLDTLYVAGMPIIQGDAKDLNSMQTVVRTPFLIIPKGATISKEQVEFDQSGFEWADKHLSGQMETLAGSFIATDVSGDQGGAGTKIEAAQNAERQLAVKNGVLGRFFGHYADLQSCMQRKIYNPENLKEGLRIFEENEAKKAKGIRVMASRIFKWLKDVLPGMDKTEPQEESNLADADAVQTIVDLLTDGLTVEDIAELALSPAGNNIEERPEEQDAKTLGYIDQHIGSPIAPYFNMKEVATLSATTAIGEDRAKRFLLPDQEDPNVAAVAERQQIFEMMAMQAPHNRDINAASTDMHPIHRKVVQPVLQALAQTAAVAPTQEMNDFAKRLLSHYSQHVAMDTTLKPGEREQEEAGIAAFEKVFMGADKAIADLAAQAAAAGVQGGAGAVPPPINGAPVQATGPGGAMEGSEGDLERKKLEAETMLRAGDQEIQHRKLDIEEKKLDSKEEQHATDLTMNVLRENADKRAQATQQGMEEGQAEIEQQTALAREEAQRQADAQNPNKPSI